MRFGSAVAAAAVLVLSSPASPGAGSLAPVHRQRYAMGTMFDVLIYHASPSDAGRAAESALAEIVRLDGMMSHFQADSALSRLNRDAGRGAVTVPPELYDVITQAQAVSRLSRGRFDITVGPLVKMWQEAASRGEGVAASAVANAQRCVGYDKIELLAPDRIRFLSACTELDLGGIGKGYAVDRAMAVLTSAGIEHAIVNAGGSSIAAIGAPSGRRGWPVRVTDGRVLLLRGRSLSTSQQDPAASGIIDPHRGTPAGSRMAVGVVAASAAVADALSTALVMLTADEAAPLLAHFGDVSALWMASSGEVHAAYRLSALELAHSQ